ncbi:hypothetical protein ACLQ2R_19525 [Streptosporangium sp. DT93]|uniref:hypothetical protein n=1 Tax=Streptosporangium sp. DT93 TaxID=3393428 RepID=UPI003CF5958F
MNDRSSPDGDRLVHKAAENDDRTVRKFDEDDLNASRHAQNASHESLDPRPDDTPGARHETPRTGPEAGDGKDVADDGPRDRHTADDDLISDHDAPLSAGRRDVREDPDDGTPPRDAAASRPVASAHGTDSDSDTHDLDTRAAASTAHDRTTDAVPPGGTVPPGEIAPSGGVVPPAGTGFPDSTAGRPDDVLDEGTGFTGAEPPATSAAHAAPPATSTAEAATLFEQDSDGIRRRWQVVQASFVDDPREAVERADSLLDEVTNSFRSALEARTAELQGRWKNNEKNDTEDLRTALRDYRATLEQLLNISAGTR